MPAAAEGRAVCTVPAAGRAARIASSPVPAAGRVVRIASLLAAVAAAAGMVAVAVPAAVDMVVVAVIARTMHASVLVQGQGLGCGRGSVRAIGGMSAFECTVPVIAPASTAVLGRSLFGAGAKVSCPYPRDVPHGRWSPRTRASRLLALSPTRQLPRYSWA